MMSLDHRFPTNVFLTSVDDLCPNQIYPCPARNFSFIIEIIHLLVSIRCPNSGKYSPCAQIPNWMQNSTLPLLRAFCEQFQFSTLNRPKWQSESYLKNSGCVCNGYRSGGRGPRLPRLHIWRQLLPSCRTDIGDICCRTDIGDIWYLGDRRPSVFLKSEKFQVQNLKHEQCQRAPSSVAKEGSVQHSAIKKTAVKK